ncbi:MAG: helix-turn-helix domain-containing protein [Phycisphaeraceae bacterium]|nr:helix-turn-helix domain-containing protein [Phycisphaeraceae bacterium]
MADANKDMDPKEDILKKQGTLNPHPETVTDELFANHDFFDPHDIAQVKYEMLRRVCKDGWSIVQAARTFGFSRVAFYRAKTAFEKAGLPGLLPLRPGPRRPHKLSPEILLYIKESLADKTVTSSKELSKKIEQQFKISIHPRTLERAIARLKKKRQ